MDKGSALALIVIALAIVALGAWGVWGLWVDGYGLLAVIFGVGYVAVNALGAANLIEPK